MKVILLIFCISFQTLYGQHDSLLRNSIEILSHDTMLGRAAGGMNEKKALQFIQHTIKENYGLKLKKQNFTISLADNDELKCVNGYIFINNKAKETILVTAHYDHIGLGGKLSKALKDNEVHNGADDNASGVGMLIQLIHSIQKQSSKPLNYLFVFYSGHEIGLYGSQAFVANKKALIKKVKLHINLDMVGRMREQTVYFSTNSKNIENQLRDTDYIKPRKGREDLLTQSDIKWSVEQRIPAIHLTTGVHIDYHKPTDDAEYINYMGIEQIADWILHEHLKWMGK